MNVEVGKLNRKLRLSELYTSIQGEGPNVGQATQFVRFAGCNLRCPGWPCDTPHSIDPSIWHVESEKLDSEELYRRLADWPMSLTLTGGEPFLQNNEQLKAFAELAVAEYSVDIFTNGTLPFPAWLFDHYAEDSTIILDWKLSGSGEILSDQQEDTRWDNVALLRDHDALKFTVTSFSDLDAARELFLKLVSDVELDCDVYVGGVWGAIQDYKIADYIMVHELDWKLNVQLHKHIWAPDKRGV